MIEDIHPESKIGQARARLEALQAQVPPLQERLAALRSERAERQAIVDRASLASDPMEIAAAQIRVGLLDKAIVEVGQQLAPVLKSKNMVERDLSQMESDLQDKLLWGPDLQDVRVNDLQNMSIARWLEQLRDIRNQLQALIEAPGGARYEPEISVSFRRLEPGEALPTVRPSAWEQRRQASIEQMRVQLEQSVAAGVIGFTHEPVIGLGHEGGRI